MKFNKRLMALLLSIAVVMTFSAVVLAARVKDNRNQETPVLSKLSTNEQMQFLQEQGIEIPPVYHAFISSWIPIVEEDPDYPIVISNPVLYKICMQVKEAVHNKKI